MDGTGAPGAGSRVTPLESGRRAALVVATGTYGDPALQRLRAPVADAEQLAAVLARPDIAAFEVTTVIDQPARVIARELQRFLSSRRRDDLLLVYFSCHGLKDLDGSLYFAGTDTELELLAATGVSAAYVNERIDACRSNRIVVLLDCCYSGAFTHAATKGDLGVGVTERLQGQGRVVMTASNAMEYAFEGNQLSLEAPSPSLFTGTLVHGLRTGAADHDDDGRITVDELYDYVYEQVRLVTPNQTPGLFANLSGTLYLARRPDGPVDLEPLTPAPPRPAPADPGPRTRRRPSTRRWPRAWPGGRRQVVLTVAACLLVVAAAATLLVLRRHDAPADSAWQRLADLPQPVEAAATASWRDRLFVVGGVDPDPGRGPLSRVQVFDPATGDWSIGPDLPTPVNHAAAVATREALYVLGGLGVAGATDVVYRLDSPDGAWQIDRPLPEARGAGAAAFDGRRIVFGGGVDLPGTARADVWALVPGGDWQPAGQLDPPREKLTATTDGYGSVWFLGGRDLRAAGGAVTYGTVDIVTEPRVEHLGEAIPPLSAPGGVQFPGQGMCVVGGQRADGRFDGGVHCLEDGADPRPGDLTRPRAGVGAAVLRGAVYVVGGYYPGINGTALAEVYRPPA